jgi:non-ribosomal peptide synthetase component E (peptide arylation enzyme)
MHQIFILNAIDVRVKKHPNNADAINSNKIQKSGLLSYNALFSNAILNSLYFSMFNKIRSYLFSEDARLFTYEAMCNEIVTEKYTA